MSPGFIMGMAALITAVATSVIEIKNPIDKDIKSIKQEHHQDMNIHSRRKDTDPRRYDDSMLLKTNSTTTADSYRQREVKNSYRNDKSAKSDSTTIADNYVRRELTNSTRHEYYKVISDSATLADNQGRRKVSTTIVNHQSGVTYSNSATSADQQKLTGVRDSDSTYTFLDSHRQREVTYSTRYEDNVKFNSATIAYHNRGVINSDSSTIAGNYKRKEVTNSTSNDKNVTFDSVTIAKVTKTDSATIGRGKATTSESTTIANDQKAVTYSDSATISNSMNITDYRSIAADYRRQLTQGGSGSGGAGPPQPSGGMQPNMVPTGFTLPSLKSGQTYDPNMTLPGGFTLPTKSDNMPGDSPQRKKPNKPTRATSAIKYPIIPSLQYQTEPCDIVAYFCPKSYKTGKVCGRTGNFRYKTFETYCMLDYINCKEKTNMWKIIYMGECIPKPSADEWAKHQPPLMYEYHDDYFLDDIFVIDEMFHEDIMEKLEPIHTPV